MISVLTVNYHSSADLRLLADSLRSHPCAEGVELIVTNNSPEDAVCIASDSRLAVTVHPSQNVGYAAGINAALRHARGETLLVANPDVQVTTGVLDAGAAFLRDHSDVGVVLPRLRYPDGTMQPSVRRFYTWPVALYARSPLRMLGFRPRFFRHYLYDGMMMTTPEQVDWGIGAAMFLRRRDHADGTVFDERFFLYFEDVDLCYRTWARGQQVVHYPQIECTHAHRRSSRLGLNLAGWHHFRSLVRFVGKYRGLPARPGPSGHS